jgi:cell division protein FtsZ
MSESNNPGETPKAAAELRKPQLSIRVIGVGGAGGRIVDFLSTAGFGNLTFIAVDTDAQELAAIQVLHRMQLGARQTRGLGTGGDPELGSAAAEKDLDALRQHCAGADMVFLVAGLGGGTGTGVAPVLARLAKEAGALVLAFAVRPFDCEGPRRQRQAQLGLQYLKTIADGVICLPNQGVASMIDENTSLVDTYRITNELIAQGLRGIWRMVARPGLIPVGFPTLCRVMRGQQVESVLATAESRGPNRGRDVVEKLMASPFLDQGQTLVSASSVLVSLVGGPELTMAEINRISGQIKRRCETADLIMGANIEKDFRDRLELTLVVSQHPGRLMEPPPAHATPEERRELGAAPSRGDSLLAEDSLSQPSETGRPASRLVPPPPELPQERMKELWQQQIKSKPRSQRPTRLQQGQLPLEIVPKGRFDKSEPTYHGGEDLDLPTYIRRGMALN